MLQQIKSVFRNNDTINLMAVSLYTKAVQPIIAKRNAAKLGLKLDFSDQLIDIYGNNQHIRIARKHIIYLDGVMNDFRYYADAVEPDEAGIVDFSRSKAHIVKGYDLHPIIFPALAEPMATTSQYLEFANLSEGSVSIDLGAYSGLTSIMFRELSGTTGKVIAIDADDLNIVAIKENLKNYHEKTGKTVDLLEGAVWTHSDGIKFSQEGNMGSSATDIVGRRVKSTRLVKSFTLMNVAEMFHLDRVDFIKCDIEGAEAYIFGDKDFFSKYTPRIIVEAHLVDGASTANTVKKALEPFGYKFKIIQQAGEGLPLMECWVA